jgi:hypothetical protein
VVRHLDPLGLVVTLPLVCVGGGGGRGTWGVYSSLCTGLQSIADG